ncbi:hypothetical protein NPIL_689371 [Nephila pilipes]|uniref:Uncharacterized protein n=1 Tax=Nephila pilipes TaxID=299642 RepID=A0A8X6NIY6_NEPPI|nr:hypothetical protein NPIL_689371 [Nephila pilipes]
MSTQPIIIGRFIVFVIQEAEFPKELSQSSVCDQPTAGLRSFSSLSTLDCQSCSGNGRNSHRHKIVKLPVMGNRSNLLTEIADLILPKTTVPVEEDHVSDDDTDSTLQCCSEGPGVRAPSPYYYLIPARSNTLFEAAASDPERPLMDNDSDERETSCESWAAKVRNSCKAHSGSIKKSDTISRHLIAKTRFHARRPIPSACASCISRLHGIDILE